jgi:hypothetical protein
MRAFCAGELGPLSDVDATIQPGDLLLHGAVPGAACRVDVVPGAPGGLPACAHLSIAHTSETADIRTLHCALGLNLNKQCSEVILIVQGVLVPSHHALTAVFVCVHIANTFESWLLYVLSVPACMSSCGKEQNLGLARQTHVLFFTKSRCLLQ